MILSGESNVDRTCDLPRLRPEETLLDVLLGRAEAASAQARFSFLADGERLDGDLDLPSLERRARALAALLQRHCEAGDRALMLFPPSLEYIAAFFGCILAGVVAVPAYPPRANHHSTRRLEALIHDAEPAVILTTPELADRVSSFVAACRRPGLRVLTTGGEHGFSWRPPRLTGDDIAFLQYTSGSTGTPKGVVITHRNLLHNIALIVERFRLNDHPGGSAVFWLPPYHDMGLIGGVLAPVVAGTHVYLFSPMSFIQKPIRWLQAISRYRAVCSGAPNFAYDLCSRRIRPAEVKALDLRSWKIAFSGAEPVRAATLSAFAERFEPAGFSPTALLPCYGMAESTLLISGESSGRPPAIRSVDASALEQHRLVEGRPGERRRELVACGPVQEGGGVRIVDPASLRELPAGHVGEIWTSSPSVAAGYWNQPENTAAAFRGVLADTGEGPFLRTGDLGAVLDGELFVVGRSKDLIILRGKKFHPEDVETVIAGAPSSVRLAGTAAFSAEQDGEEALVIVAEIDRHAEREAHHQEIVDQITKVLADQLEIRPAAVMLVRQGSIPKTSSGKNRRHACKQAFLAGELKTLFRWQAAAASAAAEPPAPPAPAAGVSAEAAARNWFVERVAAIAGIPATAVDTRRALSDLGLDSLQSMTLIGELEEWSNCELGLDTLEEHPSIDALARYAGAVRQVQDGFRGLSPSERGRLLRRLADTRPALLGESEPIPESWHSPELFPEYLAFRDRMASLGSGEVRNPFFSVHDSVSTHRTSIDGRRMLNFSSNDYLGMAGDPAVVSAVKAAVERYGTGSAASRLLSGEKPVHRELEKTLAEWIGVEDCITFVGGNLTNVSTIGHLLGPGDLVLYDELSHDSVLRGIRLSGAEGLPFPHNDWQALDDTLCGKRRRYRKVLVFIEGIYSMDGDTPDLRRFVQVKDRHQALLMVDECLSIGVLGARGRGIGEAAGVSPGEVDIWMGGISKALASCGGYIGGSKALVSYLRYTAPGFVYTTAMSPANAAAALAALQVLAREPARVTRLQELADLFRAEARALGLDIGRSGGTPVIPIIIQDPQVCLQTHHSLFERGINVQPILYPAVPANASRLRFFVTAAHQDDEVRSATRAVAEELKRLAS